MTVDQSIDLLRDAVLLGLMVAAPVLGVCLVVGVVVGMLQASTQLHDQALVTVPRLVAVAAVLVFAGPWAMRLLMEFTQRMWGG